MRYKHERNQTHTYAPSTHGYISTCDYSLNFGCDYGGYLMDRRVYFAIVVSTAIAITIILWPILWYLIKKIAYFIVGTIFIVTMFLDFHHGRR